MSQNLKRNKRISQIQGQMADVFSPSLNSSDVSDSSKRLRKRQELQMERRRRRVVAGNRATLCFCDNIQNQNKDLPTRFKCLLICERERKKKHRGRLLTKQRTHNKVSVEKIKRAQGRMCEAASEDLPASTHLSSMAIKSSSVRGEQTVMCSSAYKSTCSSFFFF